MSKAPSMSDVNIIRDAMIPNTSWLNILRALKPVRVTTKGVIGDCVEFPDKRCISSLWFAASRNKMRIRQYKTNTGYKVWRVK